MNARDDWITYVVDGKVGFFIGCQGFTLDYKPEDTDDMAVEDQLEWMRQQLQHALESLVGD